MAKKLKLSPWHNGSVKPVHIGVYEVDYGFDNKVYAYWNLEFWSEGAYDKSAVETRKDKKSSWQNDKWRGVLK